MIRTYEDAETLLLAKWAGRVMGASSLYHSGLAFPEDDAW
jgi:hypothetical protein